MIEEFYLVGHDIAGRPVYGAIWNPSRDGIAYVALYRDREGAVEMVRSGSPGAQWEKCLGAKHAGAYASGAEQALPNEQHIEATCWRGHIVKQQKMASKPRTIHQRTLFFMQRFEITPTEAFGILDPYPYE